VIAATVWCAVVWCGWSLLTDRRVRSAVLGASVAVIIGLSVVTLSDAVPARVPGADFSTALATLIPRTSAELSPDDRYLLRAIDSSHLGAVANGLFVGLEQRGLDVSVERPYELSVGRHHTADLDDVDHLLVVIASHDRDWNWVPPPGSEPIAGYDPLTAAQRTRLRTLARSVYQDVDARTREVALPADNGRARAYLTKHGAKQAEVDEFYDLEQKGMAYTVYLVPVA
jgi:hypothetical protein